MCHHSKALFVYFSGLVLGSQAASHIMGSPGGGLRKGGLHLTGVSGSIFSEQLWVGGRSYGALLFDMAFALMCPTREEFF